MKIVSSKKFKLFKTPEYQSWLDKQTLKTQAQIAERFSKIELDGYFGEYKSLNDGVWELKWKNGRRIYYAYIEELNILILLGGNKNGQNKDITLSRKIFKKYIEIQNEK